MDKLPIAISALNFVVLLVVLVRVFYISSIAPECNLSPLFVAIEATRNSTIATHSAAIRLANCFSSLCDSPPLTPPLMHP